ncbi:transglycosylase domain-containing protein [Tsuneonella mangrovi]|uniref:transglycosylase domain-containing protein n=1 Tax=Tsuneonella mangrovi TaxID=1982042 RepID=UPI000BA20838|nr:transglycosylase domain-containing protein [Tsuneonella mangrovi]
MSPFDSWKKQGRAGREGDGHRGYFALHDSYGDGPLDDAQFDEWDHRLDRAAPLSDDDLAPARKGRGKLRWAVRIVAGLIGLFIVLVAWLAVTAPLSKSLQPIAPPQLTLLASNGTPIARNGANIDKPVEIAKLPKYVPQSFVAIEDRRFYSHWGIDPRGIARAAWSNLTSNRTEGGSTITQQLAKFTFLTPRQTLGRKAREMLIAFWLEAWLSKDQILERYLSNAYFGDNAYGLRAASLHYFSREPEDLTRSQAAMLAGLVQAPSAYAPTKHYQRAANRMKMVVQAEVETGMITRAQAARIRPPKLHVRNRPDLPTGTYFADWALPQARQMTPQGYSHVTLTTTLDARLQSIARRVVERAPVGKAQVALVAMRPNGEVVAMIGGKDYEKSPFNRATQAKRQPGSTFKLFVYLAALRSGMTPDDRIDNMPITEGSYRPQNAGGNYSKTISLEDAFAHSSNVAAVRLFKTVGSDKVIAMARDLGMTGPMPAGDPSLALGTASTTLMQLTAAYAGVAGNSFPVEPHAFVQSQGGWLVQAWNWSKRHSFSAKNHAEIEQLLRATINNGTGRAAMLSVPNYGKTGTTQDNRDALFVGFAGDLVVGVWVGNDDNTPLKGIHGGGIPARIWHDFMVSALRGPAPAPAPQPTASTDPGGPIKPMDVPELKDIPLDDKGSRLQVGQDGVTVSTQVNGIPIDLRLDQNGLKVSPGQPTDANAAPPSGGN